MGLELSLELDPGVSFCPSPSLGYFQAAKALEGGSSKQPYCPPCPPLLLPSPPTPRCPGEATTLSSLRFGFINIQKDPPPPPGGPALGHPVNTGTVVGESPCCTAGAKTHGGINNMGPATARTGGTGKH